jgi:hypothetical protein
MFRVNELPSANEKEFDLAFTLLTVNMHYNNGDHSLQFQIKAPKEDRKYRSKIVDVHDTEGPLCPTTAFAKWQSQLETWPSRQPAFRWDNGKPLTPKKFNKVLKDRFAHLPVQKFTSHCFRIEAALRLGAPTRP